MTSPQPSAALPSGIRLAIACAGLIAAAFGAATFTAPASMQRVLVMALAVGLAGALIPKWRHGAAVGDIGFLIFNGFLVNQYGELTWQGRSTMGQLVLFGLAFCLGRGQRWIRAEVGADMSVADVEPEITAASGPRQESANARMDAVKDSSSAAAHRVSF